MHPGAQAASGTPTDQGPLHRRESKGRRTPLLDNASQHSVILPPPLLGHMVLGPPGRNPGPPVPMLSWSIAPACSPAKPIHALSHPPSLDYILSMCLCLFLLSLILLYWTCPPLSLICSEQSVPTCPRAAGGQLFPRLTLAPALWLV